MKARLVFACACAGIAMTGFGATTASADDGFTGTLDFSDDTVRPGDHIEIVGTCTDPNFTSAAIRSDVLDATDLVELPGGTDGFLSATATVKQNATPEVWPVSFLCGDVTVTGYLRVADTAHYDGTLGFRAERIVPGTEIDLFATCDDPEFDRAEVVSDVLTGGEFVRAAGGPLEDEMTTTAMVGENAAPGDHTMSFTCDGKEISASFTVAGDQAAPVEVAQVAVKPKGGADTGSLDAPVEAATSSDAGVLALGAGAALLAAGGIGVAAHRRRRRV